MVFLSACNYINIHHPHTCTVPPSAPLGLTVENRTDTTVSLMWQEPNSAGGGSDLQYNLFFQTPGADSRTLFDTVSETQGEITGLSPFLSYTLFVSSETTVTGAIPEELFSQRSVDVTVTETRSGECIMCESIYKNSNVWGRYASLTRCSVRMRPCRFLCSGLCLVAVIFFMFLLFLCVYVLG